MANKIIDAYRQALAAQGLSDDRTDYDITQELGDIANKDFPQVFKLAPDFATDWADIREANAPSLGGEFGQAVKQGAKGLASTAVGGAALLTGSDRLRDVAADLDKSASENAPTIGTLEDIAPGREGAAKYLSRDALRYGVSKVGGAIPSIGEAVTVGAIGGLAGSMVEPGFGTIAGAGEGVVEGLLGKGLIKSAIKRLIANSGKEGAESVGEALVKRGLIKEATEDGVANAIRGGSQEVADVVSQQARQIAARRIGVATESANSLLLNSGEIYNETPDRGIAAGLGIISAIPDSVLPGLLVSRLFPDLSTTAAKAAAKKRVGDSVLKAGKMIGVTAGTTATEGATEWFQEGVDIVARNLHEGKPADTFTDDDLKRMREAAIAGAAGGIVAAPGLMLEHSREADIGAAPTPKNPNSPTQSGPTPLTQPPAPPTKQSDAVMALRALNKMTPEQKQGRWIELQNKPTRTAAEEAEFQVLKATNTQTAAANAGVEAPPITPVTPAATPTEAPIVTAQPAGQVFTFEVRKPDGSSELISAQGATAQDAQTYVADKIYGNDSRIAIAYQPDAKPIEPVLTVQPRSTPVTEQVSDPAAPPEVDKNFLPAGVEAPTPTGPQYQYTVQPPQTHPTTGATIPGYVQVDEIINGENTRSSTVEKLRAEGIDLPDVPASLPRGQYTQEQIQQAVAANPAAPKFITPVGAKIETPTAAPVVPSKPFSVGMVIEGNPTVDFRTEERFASISPEQWSAALLANMQQGVRGGETGNRSETRIAVALQGPDGRVIKTGLILPQTTLTATGANAIKEPALQRMGVTRKNRRVVEAGGNAPVTVAEAARAGWRPIAVIHFEGQPTKIYQSYQDAKAFDASWAATPKSTGTGPKAPTATIAADVGRSRQQILEQQIDHLGERYLLAKSEQERSEIAEQIKPLYSQLDAVSRTEQQQTGDSELPQFRTASQAIAADRTGQFQIVMGRLKRMGARVDLFAKEFFQQSLKSAIDQKIAQVQQQIQASTNVPQRNELTRQLGVLQERADAAAQAVGVSYSPYHIAVSMNDVTSANLNNLVTLLHEAAENLTQRLDTSVRASVMRAVDGAMQDIATGARAAAEQSGAELSRTQDPADMLAESIAQRLATEGITDSTLADRIVRWVKDLYYRVAMAAQRAFGAEPSPELALNWFENQMRREVGGDYDYAFASLLDRFIPQTNQQVAERFTGAMDTPGGLVDFRDPISGTMQQPLVDPITPDAVNWNLAFRTEGSGAGSEEGLEIPDPEARARQLAAAQGEVLKLAQTMNRELASSMPFEQFWALVGRGTDPRMLLGEMEKKMPGITTATIGGDRMTDVMNKQAQLQVRILVAGLERQAARREAQANEEIKRGADQLTAAAKQVNKLEGDLRNASLHEDTLKEKAQKMVRDLVRAYSRGLDTAEQSGELAEAVRNTEGLLEADPIPEQYQEFFKKVSAGEVPLFEYMKAVAELDLNLADMTGAEIREAIRDNADRDPVLQRLVDQKPLLAAISTLARQNANQVDQIQLGWLKDSSRFVAIHQELEKVRSATPEQLKQMMSTMDERVKAKGLSERIRVNYLARRRELQRASERLSRAEERVNLLEKVRPKLAEKMADLQREIGGSYSDWRPVEGAVYRAMRIRDDGTWENQERTLKFNRDGSAVDSDSIRSDIAQNRRWLEENKDHEGEKHFQEVKRYTMELANLDVQRQYAAGWNWFLLRSVDKFTASPSQQAREAGGAGIRINQKLNQFQFILRSFPQQLEGPANWWNKAFSDVAKSTGVKDFGALQSQIYDPVMYFLNTNPGLDEAAAIRQATRMARARLTSEPSADFNERFAELLRRTKESSEALTKIANQFEVLVKDPRLKGELRRALPTGWLTSMRSLRGDVVQTLISDMEKAGWKLSYKDETGDNGESIRRGVKATTFDSIDPINAKDIDERRQYFDNLRNDAALNQVLESLFTPEIKQRWLEPFINKSGTEPFYYGHNPIAQLDVQEAWQKSGGNILTWINELSKSVKLSVDKEGNDPNALFRLSMLRQLDGLFGMEAKLAFQASQTRNMFDPMGPKGHALMDARLSDLLPAEHLKFQMYDPESVHRLLGTIAFNGAFGRDGAGLMADFRDLRNSLQADRAAFESINARSTTRGGRAALAVAEGRNYRELEASSKRYAAVAELQQQMETIFGVGNPAGPFNDLRTGMAVLHGMAGQITDNPKVGAYNLLSIAMRPFAQKSLGPMAITDTAKAYGDFMKTGFGSLLEALNLNLMHASDYAKDVAASEGQVFRELPWGVVMSDQGAGGKNQTSRTDRWLIHPLKMLRAVQKKGVKIGANVENAEFPRLSVIPGLGSLNTISQIAAQAGATRLVQRLENLVERGIQHFASNPDHLSDPAYRFNNRDLGVGRLDAGVLDWFRNKTVEYNMGNLEDIVRDAMPRKAKAERLLTRDQAVKVAMMNANELDGSSSINTTPTVLQTNPILRMMMPLLRWPLWMMHTAHEGLQDKNGRANLKATAKGLATLAMWNLPVGLAFSLMMDEYDDKLMGKKSNTRGIDKLAAVPLVGPGIALIAGDRSILDNMMGWLERSAKAGNVYGLGADMINQFTAPYDPNSGTRQFSMDQRILVMSQFLNMQQAIRNLVSTDGADTWSNFWKPFAMAIGGNGAIHSLDITNKLLGLDNQESRLVMRINAQNWLRSAGRELDMDLASGGTTNAPSPLSVWSREMQLSAMANDRMGFDEAFRKAMNAARDAAGNDPSVAPANMEREALNRVLSSWRSRDPRAVFKSKPTDAQMSQLYAIMDPDGRDDVQEALRRYQNFTTVIAPTQADKWAQRQQTNLRRSVQTPEQLRRSVAGSIFH